jgi:acyl carrier protein
LTTPIVLVGSRNLNLLERTMSQAVGLKLESHTPPDAPPADEARLREVLRYCPPSTYEAACSYRKNPRPELLRPIICGVIERYVAPDLRPRLQDGNDELLLNEHLGLDSLALMEIMIRLEDVFPFSIRDDELRQVRTLGDVRRLIERQAAGPAGGAPSKKPAAGMQERVDPAKDPQRFNCA